MAKYLDLDKKQFNSSGVVPLRRGDDWKLKGTVIEKYARYQAPLDLTDVTGATGFFPASSGGSMPADAFTIVDAVGGQFEMDLAASATLNVSTEDTTTIYATIEHPTLGLMTIETEFAVVEIKDRNFSGG